MKPHESGIRHVTSGGLHPCSWAFVGPQLDPIDPNAATSCGTGTKHYHVEPEPPELLTQVKRTWGRATAVPSGLGPDHSEDVTMWESICFWHLDFICHFLSKVQGLAGECLERCLRSDFGPQDV